MAISYIYVVRKWETEQSTISEFSISDNPLRGFVLERPGPDTATPNLRLRIPEGTYDLAMRNANNGQISGQNPLPHLFNDQVPQSRYIYIHHGNFPSNTDGCLLVGTGRATNTVTASIPMLNQLKQYIQQKGVADVKLIIASSYQ